jgi:hypothetical protein
VFESRLRRPSSVGTTQSRRVCVSLVGFCGCCVFWADWFVMGFPSWWSSVGLEGVRQCEQKCSLLSVEGPEPERKASRTSCSRLLMLF